MTPSKQIQVIGSKWRELISSQDKCGEQWQSKSCTSPFEHYYNCHKFLSRDTVASLARDKTSLQNWSRRKISPKHCMIYSANMLSQRESMKKYVKLKDLCGVPWVFWEPILALNINYFLILIISILFIFHCELRFEGLVSWIYLEHITLEITKIP